MKQYKEVLVEKSSVDIDHAPAAVKPLHGENTAEMSTPKLDNASVYPADEHKQTEEVKEVIVESYFKKFETIGRALSKSGVLTEDLSGLKKRSARNTYKMGEKGVKEISRVVKNAPLSIEDATELDRKQRKFLSLAGRAVKKHRNADVDPVTGVVRDTTNFVGQKLKDAGNFVFNTIPTEVSKFVGKGVDFVKDIFNKATTKKATKKATANAKTSKVTGVNLPESFTPSEIKEVLTEMGLSFNDKFLSVLTEQVNYFGNQVLLEEVALGSVAAEPVATSDAPAKEATPDVTNKDLFPAEEHKQTEEVKEVIVEGVKFRIPRHLLKEEVISAQEASELFLDISQTAGMVSEFLSANPGAEIPSEILEKIGEFKGILHGVHETLGGAQEAPVLPQADADVQIGQDSAKISLPAGEEVKTELSPTEMTAVQESLRTISYILSGKRLNEEESVEVPTGEQPVEVKEEIVDGEKKVVIELEVSEPKEEVSKEEAEVLQEAINIINFVLNH
jgi:hypothetical protein